VMNKYDKPINQVIDIAIPPPCGVGVVCELLSFTLATNDFFIA